MLWNSDEGVLWGQEIMLAPGDKRKASFEVVPPGKAKEQCPGQGWGYRKGAAAVVAVQPRGTEGGPKKVFGGVLEWAGVQQQ